MKTIGLLGGMSWESTALYYTQLNQAIKTLKGGLHSAKIVLVSVDFDPIATLQREAQWDQAGKLLADAARQVERGGADALLLCTNTMHKVAAPIRNAISIPMLDIVEVTAQALKLQRVNKVGLLGTKFTMEDGFYQATMAKSGVAVLTPTAEESDFVHRSIFEELCLGQILPSSKLRFLDIIHQLERAGAQAVILGCTEIGMIVTQSDCRVPLIDSMQVHVAAAVNFALA